MAFVSLLFRPFQFHGYDDFCRGIIKHSSHHSSPVKPVQPPERTETRENKGEAPSAMVEVVREKTPHPKVEEPKESDFARRLRERNEQINKRTVTLASEVRFRGRQIQTFP